MSVKYPLDYAEEALREGNTPGFVKTTLAFMSILGKRVTNDYLGTLASNFEHNDSKAAELIRALARGDVTSQELSAVADFIHANAMDTDRALDVLGKWLGVDDNQLKRTN
jgi:hypothetical protein